MGDAVTGRGAGGFPSAGAENGAEEEEMDVCRLALLLVLADLASPAAAA